MGEAQGAVLARVLKRMHIHAMVPLGHVGSLELVAYGSNASVNVHSDSEKGKKRLRSIIVYLDGSGSLTDGGATVLPMGACKDVADCCVGASSRLETFEFKLDGGGKLGLKLINEEEKLEVKEIMPGIVQQWNDANPDRRLGVGSEILEVNGVVGTAPELRDALR